MLHAESCVARHLEIKRSSHMFWRKMHKQQRIQAKPEHAYLARKDGFEPRVKLRSGVHRELNKSMWRIDVNAAARLLHRSLKANYHDQNTCNETNEDMRKTCHLEETSSSCGPSWPLTHGCYERVMGHWPWQASAFQTPDGLIESVEERDII